MASAEILSRSSESHDFPHRAQIGVVAGKLFLYNAYHGPVSYEEGKKMSQQSIELLNSGGIEGKLPLIVDLTEITALGFGVNLSELPSIRKNFEVLDRASSAIIIGAHGFSEVVVGIFSKLYPDKKIAQYKNLEDAYEAISKM